MMKTARGINRKLKGLVWFHFIFNSVSHYMIKGEYMQTLQDCIKLKRFTLSSIYLLISIFLLGLIIQTQIAKAAIVGCWWWSPVGTRTTPTRYSVSGSLAVSRSTSA